MCPKILPKYPPVVRIFIRGNCGLLMPRKLRKCWICRLVHYEPRNKSPAWHNVRQPVKLQCIALTTFSAIHEILSSRLTDVFLWNLYISKFMNFCYFLPNTKCKLKHAHLPSMNALWYFHSHLSACLSVMLRLLKALTWKVYFWCIQVRRRNT